MDLRQRVERKIERQPDGCWLWTGMVDRDGYALVYTTGRREDGKSRVARLMYEWNVGPLGDLVPDHLCRVRRCVNPAHLEAVTNEENVLRGEGAGAVNARKTHCPRGHPYSHVSGGKRRCRTCNTEDMRRRRSEMPIGTRPGYKHERDDSGLTKRERDVLDLMVEGLDGPQIGERLGITKQRVGQIQKALVVKGRLRHEGERLLVLREAVVVQKKKVSDVEESME